MSFLFENKKRYLKIFIILLLEFILFGVMAFVMYKYYFLKNNLSEITVVPLKKKMINFIEHEELNYFYETPSDFIVEEKPDWLSYSAKYSFNSDTFNERFEYEKNKPINTFRIITLGDSFTFGQYVNTEDNWSEKLEDALNKNKLCRDKKTEVINLGVYGYDLEYSVHRYLLRGQKYNPDLVILFLPGDRWNELMTEKRFDYESKMTEKEKSDAKKKGIYPSWVEAEKYIEERYSEQDLLEKSESLFEKLMIAHSGKILIISMSNSEKEYTDRLKIIVSKNELISFFANIPAFESFDGLLPDGHPNKKGHKKVADEVFSYLFSSGMISCN